MTLEEHLKQMQEIDVRDIDPTTLPDIKDIHADMSLPPAERMASVLRQMNGNPYFFRSGRIIVKTSFKGEVRLQTVLEDLLENF